MLLLKDALVVSSNGCQVLLELRGVGTMPREVLDVLIMRASGVTPFLDDALSVYTLLFNEGEGFILLTLFKAFEETKAILAIVDG